MNWREMVMDWGRCCPRWNLKKRLTSSTTFLMFVTLMCSTYIQCVPLATEPGISLIILPLMTILQRNLERTTDTFLFISHTTNVLLFKFRCNIFTGVRILKEMPGLVASGTHCINIQWRISQTQQNFIMLITVLGRHVSILIESSSGPSKNTDPYLAMFKMRLHWM